MSIWSGQLRFLNKAKLPMIFQEEIAECAQACIAMIAHFWRKKLCLSTLRQLHPPSIRGMSVLQILAIFERLGFRVRVLRLSYQDLNKIKLPAILHWNTNHFVVLKKVRQRTIYIHDPAIGICKYSEKDGSRFFSGVALEIEESTDVPILHPEAPLTILKFLKSVVGMRKIVSMILILSLLLEFMHMLHPLFMQYMMDYVIDAHALSQLYSLGLGCGLFALLQGLTECLRSHLLLYTAMRTSESFSVEIFKHLLQLPLKFFMHRQLSDIQTKFQSIEQLCKQLSTELFPICLDGLMMIATLVVMCMYSVILTSIIMAVFILYAGLLFWTIQTYKTYISSALTLHAKTVTTVQETIRGIATLKSFVKETVWLQWWRNDYVDALNQDILTAKIQIRFRVVQQIMSHIDYIIIICIAAGLVISQQLTMGMLFAFLAYRTILVNKAMAFIHYIFSYHNLTIQLQRLQDLFLHSPDKNECPAFSPPQLSGAIHVRGLAFAYPGSPSLFSNLNFNIHAGEKVAIVGPSGCGKTTLIKIMLGLEQPTEGAVFLDDWPIVQFGWHHFRCLSASVLQEDLLFTGSILDNITFFAESVDMDHVYKVTKLTCIHDTIMSFPLGYEMMINQMQGGLSGGQKQRLLLARALYKKPQFLFLDEATSHLDPHLEATINQALQTVAITQIIATHRPDTIARVDRVIDLGFGSTDLTYGEISQRI